MRSAAPGGALVTSERRQRQGVRDERAAPAGGVTVASKLLRRFNNKKTLAAEQERSHKLG